RRRALRETDSEARRTVPAGQLEGRRASHGARALEARAVVRAGRGADAAPALEAVTVGGRRALAHPARVAVRALYPRAASHGDGKQCGPDPACSERHRRPSSLADTGPASSQSPGRVTTCPK